MPTAPLALRRPSTSVNSARFWSSVRRVCVWSTKTDDCSSTIARLRELTGYEKDELELFDTKQFWHDLDQRTRIITELRSRGGQLLNQKVIWRTKNGTVAALMVVLRAGRLPRRPYQFRRRQARILGLRRDRADATRGASRRAGAPTPRNPRILSGWIVRSRRRWDDFYSTIGGCAN